ncbi:MAG: 6-carboxytetrahydropterin synthase [Planctomycetota bacterium]
MLICRDFSFDAAHHLVAYQGKCERVHGHTYKLRVCVEEPVGADGLAFDFVRLKAIVNGRVIDILDHTDLNGLFPQPSCELVAVWIWDALKADLHLAEIRLWETPESFVVYRGV